MLKWQLFRALLFSSAALAVIVSIPVVAATTSVSALVAFHHVPPYPNHILGIDIQSAPSANSGGSYAIKTSDSVAVVSAWYKQHLPDVTADHVTSDGHHVFYTKNGSTVDVGKAIAFAGNYTIIGVVASK
jgi:hypothetical protein